MLNSRKIFSKIGFRQLYVFCLVFFAALLPFQPKWLPLTLGIMLMGLFWVVSLGFRQKLKFLAENRAAGLFFLYYLIIVLGCFYSLKPGEAEEELLLKFPFLAWAIMLGSIFVLYKVDMQRVLRVFVGASALAMLLSFVGSLYSYMALPLSTVFYFEELVRFKMVPPHYLGLFVNFSYTLVLHSFLSRQKHKLFNNRTSIFLLGLFFISIIFISVRMQYVVFVLVNALLAFGYILKRHGRYWAAGTFVGVLAVFFGLIMSFSGTRNRIVDTYHEIRSFEGLKNNKQTNPRKFLWHSGLEVIKDHFWLGTGTGAENDYLHENLRDKKIVFWDGTSVYHLHEKGYNYHNTYLQTFAAHGILGLLSLVLIFIWPVIKRPNIPFKREGLLFLLICGLSFTTESMLQRQAGVLFFSFFYSLFFVLKLPGTGRAGQKIGEEDVQ